MIWIFQDVEHCYYHGVVKDWQGGEFIPGSMAALQTCIADGGTLAKPETAAENTEIQTLLGEKNKIIMWKKNLDWFLRNYFKYNILKLIESQF